MSIIAGHTLRKHETGKFICLECDLPLSAHLKNDDQLHCDMIDLSIETCGICGLKNTQCLKISIQSN